MNREKRNQQVLFESIHFLFRQSKVEVVEWFHDSKLICHCSTQDRITELKVFVPYATQKKQKTKTLTAAGPCSAMLRSAC